MPLYVRLALKSFFHQKRKACLMIAALLFCFVSAGTLLNSKYLFEQLLQNSQKDASAADITYYTGLFSKETDIAASMTEVKKAEAKSVIRSRAKLNGNYMNLSVQIMPDHPAAINKIKAASGSSPAQNEIWLESSTARHAGVETGEKIDILLPQNQNSTSLPVSRNVQDTTKVPAEYSGTGYAYLSEKTAKKLGIPISKNVIHIVLEDGTDTADAVRSIQKHLENEGITVYRSEVSSETFFIRETLVHSLFLIFLLLGGFGSVLGFILIFHLFYRILSEDAYTLSIQKIVGATSSRIVKQYALLIAVIGFLISIISIPLISLASNYLVRILGAELNLGSSTTGWISPRLALSLVLASFILPLAGAFFPVRRLIINPVGDGMKLSYKLKVRKKGLTRSRFFHFSLLSVRNLSVKKAQFFMNIVMLAFGGAVILACFSLLQSLQQEIKQTEEFWQHDVEWSLKSTLSADEITSIAESMSGIRHSEGWTKRNTEVSHTDASIPMNSLLYALPAATNFIQPEVVSGSWLDASQPDDIVINTELDKKLGPFTPGDTISLKIGKESREWRVLGIIKNPLSGPSVYMEQNAYQKWIGQKSVNRLLASKHPIESAQSLLAAGEQKLSTSGVLIEGSETAEDITSRPKEMIGLVVWTVACTGFLFAAVGTANLMVAASISTFERTSEIGIMRSLGASNARIYGLFIWESVLTALMGWILACALSWPVSLLLGHKIGDSLLHVSLEPYPSIEGCGMWLAISLLTGAASGALPVKRALSKRINEIL